MAVLNVRDILRSLELLLHLFAFFFPEQATVQDNSSYDFIIVGAGSAGCVLASRLSENANVSVLLIEDGGNPTLEVMLPGLASFNQFSKFDWNYTSVNNSNAFQCYLGDVFQLARGHGLGGSSSINYMLYARGDPNDYKQWAKIANSSMWDYDHVLPYFKRSERMEDPVIMNSTYKTFHGTTGPMGVSVHPNPAMSKYLKALKEVGYKTVLDTNGNNTLGFNFPTYTVSRGLRQSTCFSFVSPVRYRKNLHVLKNAKVIKVVTEGTVAVGVKLVRSGNKTITVKANHEVILSAGAFNTPQLLMLSGIGPQEHLESFNITVVKNLPVGYNLQDHIGAIIAHQTEANNSTDTATNPFEPQESYINGFITLNESQTFPDSQFLFLSTNTTPGILGLFGAFDNDIYEKAMSAGNGTEILLNFILNLRSVSRGRVMLNSTDPTDPPKIYHGAFTNQTDVNNMVRYIKDYLRIENSTYFKSVQAQRVDLAGDRCSSFTMGSDDYWKCYSRCLMISIFHYSGTCPMGTVVDSRLRVIGVSKLRVVDASVFPVIPSGNINAPTIMTAEKAADIIKKDHNITVTENSDLLDYDYE